MRTVATRRDFSDWPKVETRMQRAEVECLRATLRAQGLTLAQWIRQQLSGVPSRGNLNPKVKSLSYKLPEPFAQAAHDALLIQAVALVSISERQKKDSPLEANANRRVGGEYVDAAGFFGSVVATYAELERKQQGDGATSA